MCWPQSFHHCIKFIAWLIFMTDNLLIDETFIGDVLFVDVEKKEKQLTVNSASSVQPVALLRLGVFVPRLSNSKKNVRDEIDASAVLSGLELAKAEGFDNIKITGDRLSMDVDFKVWLGIVIAFSKHGLRSNKINIEFTEFAKYCGYSSHRITEKLRLTIHDSLVRIRGKTLSFRRGKARSGYVTGLLKTGSYNADKDVIELEGDERLWELYKVDYRVILQQHAIKALPKKESAQALYTFIESLPANPIPVSFSRLRDRLALTTPVGDQNRIIKRAIKHLQDIGYLSSRYETKEREQYLVIESRNPKLTA